MGTRQGERRNGRQDRASRRAGRDEVIVGTARVDKKTKALVKRLQPGEIAVIDHEDIDRVAAETLVEAGASAVINASTSSTGRYPNEGPLILLKAGVLLVDEVGAEIMEDLDEGTEISVVGSHVLVGDHRIATGIRQSIDSIQTVLDEARRSLGAELERFAENTLEYLSREHHLVRDDLEIPDVGLDFANRQVLLVVRGSDYKEDLALLRGSGYIQELRPILVGVDGGADALLERGLKPDLIIGDFDSVSEQAICCGAKLVVHAYEDGRAPGATRLQDLGAEYQLFGAAGTSEDIAMLLAYEKGAELIVAVGTHNSMVEFLDKGREGMASTFLVRMKVGPILVDAKGVSRLYKTRIRKRDLSLLILSAIFTLVVITLVSEPVRVVLRGFWFTLTN